MRALLVLLTVFTLAAGHAAAGEPTSDRTVREQLVRRYFKAMEFEKLMDSMIISLIPVMVEQTSKDSPDLTPEQRELIADVIGETMREVMTPRIIEAHVGVYADAFSEPELKALVDFYESPHGRSIMQKTPSLMPKAAAISRELMPQMEQEVMTRVCARVDCGAMHRPKARPS